MILMVSWMLRESKRECLGMKDDLPHRQFQLPARERDFAPDVTPLPDQNNLHLIPNDLASQSWCLGVHPDETGLMRRG